MVDRIPLADFDNGVSEIADANGNVLWNETEAVSDTEVAPQVDATPTQVGQEDAENLLLPKQSRSISLRPWSAFQRTKTEILSMSRQMPKLLLLV